jgi:hypothetical protein
LVLKEIQERQRRAKAKASNLWSSYFFKKRIGVDKDLTSSPIAQSLFKNHTHRFRRSCNHCIAIVSENVADEEEDWMTGINI